MEASSTPRAEERRFERTGDGALAPERVQFVPTPIADPGPLGLEIGRAHV